MRKSGRTPSIVPDIDDQNVYLVLDDFGRNGRVWRETDVEVTDLETVIMDLLDGQYKNPVRVVAFNTAEKWSQDVSADVAHELRRRCDLQMRDVPFFLARFRAIVTKAAIATSSCRCRCAWCDRGVPAQEAGRDRRQGALPRLHRAGAGTVDRARCRSGDAGSTRSSSTATASKSTSPTRRCKVFTRRGHDWTNRFKKIADDAWHISAGSAIIDGEVVVPAADGTTDFSVLQNELRGKSDQDRDGRVRSALSQRLRPAEAAADRAQGAAEKADRRNRRSNSAKASRSTAARCSSTPARSGLRAWSRRCATASTRPAGATIGSRKPALSARR